MAGGQGVCGQAGRWEGGQTGRWAMGLVLRGGGMVRTALGRSYNLDSVDNQTRHG